MIINGDGGCSFWQPEQADSQPKSSGLALGLGSAAAWRHSTFTKWTGWTFAMALPWWQHHKHCLGYYYYYLFLVLYSSSYTTPLSTFLISFLKLSPLYIWYTTSNFYCRFNSVLYRAEFRFFALRCRCGMKFQNWLNNIKISGKLSHVIGRLRSVSGRFRP